MERRESERLSLRKFQNSDILLLRKWLYEKHVAPWFEHPDAWLEEAENRSGRFFWIHHSIVTCEGTDIGFCQYYNYKDSKEDWHGDVATEGTYSMDYLLGDSAYLKKGLGREMARLLLCAIVSQPDAQRVIVQPDSDNFASCGTLLSVGFHYDAANRLYLREIGRTISKTADECKPAKPALT